MRRAGKIKVAAGYPIELGNVIRALVDEGLQFEATLEGGYWEIEVVDPRAGS